MPKEKQRANLDQLVHRVVLGARVAGLALPCLFENALTALLAVNEKIRVGLQTNITVKVQDRWGRTHREAFGSGRR